MPSEKRSETYLRKKKPARHGMLLPPGKTPKKRRRIIQMWTSGIAAAIVVLVVLIVPRITNKDTIQDIEIFAALDVPEAIITSESNGRITLSTPPATTMQITLDDGTQVTLSANSRLEYPKQFPAEGTREVRSDRRSTFRSGKR